ncbi:MAG: hypothetical protein ACKOB0_09345 [Chthoniobacterales bacterium]
MDRSTVATDSIMPGTAVLTLCAAILFAGYVAAVLRPVDRPAPAATIPSADPGNETAEP